MGKIINSLIDTDLYKYTMMQVVYHNYPSAMVKMEFKCRNADIDLSKYADEIREEIKHLCNLSFRKDEIDYLQFLGYFKPSFIQYLRNFGSLDFSNVTIDSECNITLEGSWLSTILFEVFILSIVNEVYFRHQYNPNDITDVYHVGVSRLKEKIKAIKSVGDSGFKICEFGTRRRFSREWQDIVTPMLADEVADNFVGTSNILLAKENGLKPIGTMAHEYLQAHQAFVPVKDSQRAALQTWVKEYGTDLGIALTDVISMNAFLTDFDKSLATIYSGCRHDSGDPGEWCEQLIEHYLTLDIDPKTKVAVFSDGLDVPLSIELYNRFKGKIQMVFAIGTNLTNDMGFKPLSIVLEMTKCNGHDVAKLSDNSAKTLCKNEVYLNYLKSAINY